MTRAQMIALVTALGNNGFSARTIKVSDTPETWYVRSNSNDINVAVGTVNTFANNQGVGAFIAEVEYR